ncbi:efflux transporter outer membrane subunit [Parabacteroides sp. PF5-9]|uniref:efflux transporter outer membrane subunit n=1 Tax=Parabacteroides sp. PF5-9 TaxID=1742404 RepID=UPI002475DF60|nr:efflux transporter outer membrane subunit [Parabacteroides sp. PF5-9]MDH6359225.1 multidrug efflux system outer membrane protein [Parabacteroides sp. PF5-9]
MNKKQIIPFILLISVSFLFKSCGIYSSYSRPDIEKQTDRLYRDLQTNEDTLSLGDLDWRSLFTDPALHYLIERGLENNTDMRSAYLRVNQAEAALLTARLSFLPSFNFALDGAVSRFNNSNSHTYTLPVVASWEVDIFGRIRNAKQRIKAAYEQSQEYQQAVQTQLIASIANTYYTLLMLDSQLEISEETARSWKENVSTMQALMDAGMANDAAVSQTQANYYAIEASLFDLKRQIYEVENSLSLLLGESPYLIQRSRLKDVILPEELSTGIPVQLLANRPDVKSAEYALQQAFYTTAEAKSAFYPSLVLNGTAGWTNNAGAFIVNPGKLLLSAVGSLTQPIFNKGALRANLKISKAQQEEATLAFKQTILNAGTEVINALKQVETARSKTTFRTRQIQSLASAVESTELLMSHGSSTYLEVLTAQQALLTAQLTRVADRFEEVQGVINLYHALGGGRDHE